MPRFNLIIIGDELLNARRQDRHLANSIALLQARGLELYRSMVIGDTPELIIETLKYLRRENDIVFCFGGIGATPDDFTRQCAAKAFDVDLEVHEEGRQILEKKFGEQTYPHRIELVTIPKGAILIPNFYNEIPGFSFENFHFLPGFPQMAESMTAWVLDTYYQTLQPSAVSLRHTARIYGRGEGAFMELMNELLLQFPGVKLSCLPCIDHERNFVDLSLSGATPDVNAAFSFMSNQLNELAVEWEVC